MRQKILEALPLVRASVLEDRETAELPFVGAALRQFAKGTVVSSHEVCQVVLRLFPGIAFTEETITLRLERLKDEKVLQDSRGGYEIVDISPLEPALDPLDQLASRFLPFLGPRRDELAWLKGDWKLAFHEIILTILDELVASLGIGDAEKLEFGKGAENRKHLLEIATKHGLPDSGQFVDLTLEFIRETADRKDSVVVRVLEAALQYDLLLRSSRLTDIATKITPGAVVFLDTNILVGLMCPEDFAHELCKVAISLSRTIGYQLVYLTQTAKEFEELLAAWADPYEEYRHAPRTKDLHENPLARHWHEVKGKMSWAELKGSYDNFRVVLRSEYDIAEWTGEVEHPDQEFIGNFSELYHIARARSPREYRLRSAEADYHDGCFLKTISSLRVNEGEGAEAIVDRKPCALT